MEQQDGSLRPHDRLPRHSSLAAKLKVVAFTCEANILSLFTLKMLSVHDESVAYSFGTVTIIAWRSGVSDGIFLSVSLSVLRHFVGYLVGRTGDQLASRHDSGSLGSPFTFVISENLTSLTPVECFDIYYNFIEKLLTMLLFSNCTLYKH